MHTLTQPSPAEVAAARAAYADRERRLHQETVAAVTAAGFARHFVPARWGGDEGGFADLLDRAARLGESCASAAWCAALWATHARYAAYLPAQAQRELWADSPDVRIAAGLMPPSGSLLPVPGGWQLNGEWSCVSGVRHARWLLLSAVPAGASPQEALVLLVPAAEAAVLDDWHSTGLRGTGSSTVVLAPVDVPRHRSFPLAEMLRGTPAPGRARCHAVPALLGGTPLLASPVLGAARHALRAWTAWAAESCAGRGSAADEALARSSAEIQAAGLLLEHAARRADTEQGARAVAENRRDTAFAADLLVTAVERLFRTGGAHARGDSGELQRCWRDAHTAAAHGALRTDAAAAGYAEAVLGPADRAPRPTAARSA